MLDSTTLLKDQGLFVQYLQVCYTEYSVLYSKVLVLLFLLERHVRRWKEILDGAQ